MTFEKPHTFQYVADQRHQNDAISSQPTKMAPSPRDFPKQIAILAEGLTQETARASMESVCYCRYPCKPRRSRRMTCRRLKYFWLLAWLYSQLLVSKISHRIHHQLLSNHQYTPNTNIFGSRPRAEGVHTAVWETRLRFLFGSFYYGCLGRRTLPPCSQKTIWGQIC